jgi:hypothetical protein
MHPFDVFQTMQENGFWFTYWNLRNVHGARRGTALWLIWIAFWLSRPVSRMLDKMF